MPPTQDDLNPGLPAANEATQVEQRAPLPGESLGASDLAQAVASFSSSGDMGPIEELMPTEAVGSGVADASSLEGQGVDPDATEAQAVAEATQDPTLQATPPSPLETGTVAEQPQPAAPVASGNPELDTLAQSLTITPTMVQGFRARNPLFKDMDDATAERALRVTMANRIMRSRAEQAQAEASGEPEPPPNPERPYSIWRDLASVPGAIAAGAAKGIFESYDAVNEIALGNEYDPSEMRKGIEGYYDGTSGVSGAAAVVAQFGVMFVGIGKFARAARLFKAPATTGAAVGQAAATGAVTDFLAFDGLEGRLSDVVMQYPALENPINDYLATKPGDSQATGRLKNAIEGLGLGVAADVVLAGLRAVRAKKALDHGGEGVDKTIIEKEVEEAIDEASTKFDATAAVEDADPGPAFAPGVIGDEPQMRIPEADAEAAGSGGQRTEGGDPGTAQAAPEPTPTAPPSGPTLDPVQLESTVKDFVNRVIREPGVTAMDTTVPGSRGEIPQRVPTPSTFDSLTEMGSLRGAIDQVEKGILREIEGSASARGRVALEETRELAQQFADDTGQSAGEFFARMMKDAGDVKNLHARLHAYNAVTKSLAEDIVQMARGINEGTPGEYGSVEALVDAFETRMAQYAQVQDWLKGVRSEAGRTLNIMRYSETAGMAIDASGILNSGARGRSPAEMAQAVVMMATTPKKLRKRLGEIAEPGKWAKWRDAAVSLYIKNILSGPWTQVVNIAGNTTAALMHPATKILGGAMGRDPQIVREGLRQYAFMVTETTHALKMAANAYRLNQNILDPRFSKYSDEGFHAEALSTEALTGGMVPNDTMIGALGNGVFKVIDAVSTRALGAGDEFFKQSLYASEIAARAWSEGVGQGLQGQALKEHIMRARANAFTTNPQMKGIGAPPTTATAAVEPKLASPDQIESLDVARFGTFTNAPQQGSFARSMLELTNRHPELKIVVPFVRVVRNIMAFAGHHSPLAPLATSVREAIARGGRDKAVAYGRMALGTAIWTASGLMAYNDMLTGEGPVKSDGSPDWKRREMLKATGWKPNAIKIGDTYIDASRLDPLGLPLNMAARIKEAYDRGQMTDSQMEEVAAAMALGLGHTLADRQYLKGFADLFEALYDDSGSAGAGYVGRLVSSIAIPNFARQTVGMMADPTLRHAKGFVENFLRNTPGASTGLAAKRMPWGEAILKGTPLWSKMAEDPVTVEFARLLETGDSGVGQPLPRMWTVTGGKSIDTATFKLSNGETLYDQYAEYIMDPAPGELPPLKEALQGLINSREYKEEMVDGAGAFRGTRLKAWQTYIARYRDVAKRRILSEFPEVRERINGPRVLHYQQGQGDEHAAERRRKEMQEFIDQ